MYFSSFDLQAHYYLKWEDYTNRHNTWEPIENLTGCAELLAEFEKSRAIEVLGVARCNGEIVYIIQFRDTTEPDCVNSGQVRIHWTELTFNFLLSKITFVGFAPNELQRINFLQSIPSAIDEFVPKIICK